MSGGLVQLGAVALGGAAGSCLRYGISLWFGPSSSAGWPLGTLAANLLGCLLIGVVAGLLPESGEGRGVLRLFLVAGCLGGFTTFSSFGLETLNLMSEQRISAAVTYLLASNIGGITLCWLGWWLTGFFRS